MTIGPALEALADGLGYADGVVLALHAHGMLEDPCLLRALFGQAPRRTLDRVFDELADAVEAHLDLPFLMREAGIA